MSIFQKSVLKKHLNNLNKEKVEKAYLKFRENYNPSKITQIKTLKEEEYQDGFLREIFVDVLGYTLRPDENYNLQREFKNQTDEKKADGAILKDENAIVVIELKSTKTKDLSKITQQAFNYKNNQPECKYVITSNFQKLRFYVDYSTEYEEFDLFHLEKEQFEVLYLILNKESIYSNLPLKIKEETRFHEQQISNTLYKEYSHFKNRLFNSLVKNNTDKDKLTLFKKSQKLLDRFLFILFAEDSGLLPPNSISRIVKRFDLLKEEDAYKPVYDIFKQYFGYMNIGRKGKTASDDIPAYNGGLFYTDELIDNLVIDDSVLIDELLNLSKYDFNTEVDVNILGQIFEHSLNEIEEITAEIEGRINDKTKSKRKKDGVFYTPKYITQYIVENTVGTLCNEKRKELNIEEIEFDGTYRTKTEKLSEKGKKLFSQLKEYKDWLLTLKIVDPACGSGAFLNQALNFLIEEHKTIDDIIAELTNSPMRLFDVDKSILENNLFGVDINDESVEIAKLSLWLRTAQKGRKLSNLNNNIKCGNSLIDDPKIAGDKAFNWNTEFPQVFKEKDKKAYHITTAIHDSRTSARMKKYKVRERREMGTNPYPNIIYFTKEADLLITETIAEIVKKDKIKLLAYNICADHIHLLLVCDIKEVPQIIQKIKSVTSKIYTREHAPLSKTENKKPLWQQKYSQPKEITSNNQLQNTINYIQKNRSKHELPEHSKEIKLIIQNMCVDFETAMQPEYTGGFDCVIGNPPYVSNRNIDRNHKLFYLKNYKSAYDQYDLYVLFIELAVKINKIKGFSSFILPDKFLISRYGEAVMEFLSKEISIISYWDLTTKKVFPDASVYPIVYVFRKTLNDKIINYTLKNFKQNEVFKTLDNSSEIVKKIENVELIDFKVWRPLSTSRNLIEGNMFSVSNSEVNRYSLKHKKGKFSSTNFRENDLAQPKILLKKLCYNIEASIDFIGVLPVNTTYCLTLLEDLINLKYILSLLNSKLLSFFARKKYINTSLQGGYIELRVFQVKELPLIKISKEAQQPFIEKADKMLVLNKELQEKSTRFIKRLIDNFELQKINKKLNSFYKYDFKIFVAELKKQKINLSLVKQDEWEDYFDVYKTEINQLQNTIQQTDNEIDKMVYELYNLSDDEIIVIENS